MSDANGNAFWRPFDTLMNGRVANGLYFNNTLKRIQQGGSLTENTTITGSSFNYTMDLTGTGNFKIVEGSGTAPSFFIKGNEGFSTDGFVGIGTNSPLARLHVADSSVVFTGQNTLPLSPRNPPVSGAGHRMMWYADKAAFRVGGVLGTIWDKDSVGKYSFASGYSTKAIGESSSALGYFTVADGDYSAAIGYSSKAIGRYSISLGFATEAIGENSISIGYQTIATGFNSTAIGGRFSRATGTLSTVMGFSTEARGNTSTAMGVSTKTKSIAGTVIGMYNDTTDVPSSSVSSDTDRLFQIGNGTSISIRSNAVTVLNNGNTGIGPITPEQKLDVDGGFILRDGGAIASTATTNITPSSSNRAYYRIAPTNTPGNRAITLEDGTEAGQMIILQCQAANATYGVRLTDGGNIQINTATLDLLNNDAATFIWDGNEWILIAYINN